MTSDMSGVIIPKSDQWNADDFITGPLTFRIKGVAINPGQEQPVSISLEGSDRVYRCCKSMARVLVAIWGADARLYVGRRLTLYRDPSVKWGGLAVGGIRISHMSNLLQEKTMALAETRANRRPFTVKPLADEPIVERADVFDLSPLLAEGDEHADRGMAALEHFWKSRTPQEKRALGGPAKIEAWKAIAKQADEAFASEAADTTEQAA